MNFSQRSFGAVGDALKIYRIVMATHTHLVVVSNDFRNFEVAARHGFVGVGVVTHPAAEGFVVPAGMNALFESFFHLFKMVAGISRVATMAVNAGVHRV